MAAQGEALLYRLPNQSNDNNASFARRGGVGQASSSFGMDATTLGPEYGAASIFGGQRRAELEFRGSFYRGSNHDKKCFDINGGIIPAGKQSVMQPLMSQGSSMPAFFVPMNQRRPNNPFRLGRKMVNSFTGMLFSEGRWPQMRSDDPVTQDWAEALVTALKLQMTMIRARNSGGACGLVGISWGWIDGLPRARAHEGKNLHCLKWSEDDDQIPEHVTELYQIMKPVVDKKGRVQMVPFWHRRDWTPLADVVFRDVEVTEDEPNWEAYIDEKASFIHDHGRIHFEWIANLPDDEVDSNDGQPDYAEVYEPLNTLDISNSVVVMGSIRNLDPTLVLKVDENTVASGLVQKGSDHGLIVGPQGDAKYLELSGATITAGISLVDKQAQQILDVCECVLPDPDKVAASGLSSVAMKMVYAPMIAKCDILRTQYGGAIERLIDGLTDFARAHAPDLPGQEVLIPFVDDDGEPILDEDGEEQEEAVKFFVKLPPKKIETPVLDENGAETGEHTVTEEERQPGKGIITTEWGEYFKPTSDDLQKSTTSITAATGGKPVLSQRTAVELAANLYGRDPTQEWVDVSQEAASAREHDLAVNSGMYPRPGDDGTSQLVHPDDGGDALTDEDAIDAITVNEIRQIRGKGPLKLQDGSINPDGFLPFAEYKAKVAAKGTVDGETEAGAPPVEAPPKMPEGNVPGEPGLTEKPFGGGLEVTPPAKPNAAVPHAPAPPKPPAPKAE